MLKFFPTTKKDLTPKILWEVICETQGYIRFSEVNYRTNFLNDPPWKVLFMSKEFNNISKVNFSALERLAFIKSFKQDLDYYIFLCITSYVYICMYDNIRVCFSFLYMVLIIILLLDISVYRQGHGAVRLSSYSRHPRGPQSLRPF